MSAVKQIFADVPTSAGMENALRRSKQLADLRWTPIRPLPAGYPTVIDGEKIYHKIFLPPWRPQTGANYSGARFDEKYIGFNVSIHTYMTALANPDSAIYTRSLHGRTKLASAFYGTVCSEFVSYVLDMPFHIDCQQWPYLDGIEEINPLPLENLKLCDVLNEATRHTAIITGINRDAEGKVVDITVTESTLPHIQSRTFEPNEFVEYWLKDNYSVLRYHKIDKVTYTPSPWNVLEGDPEAERPVPNPVLMPDYGEKADYLLGEEVTLNLFQSGYTAVELYLAEEKTAVLEISDGKAAFKPEKIGYYQAVAVGEGLRSEPAEFCIVDGSVTTDKLEYKANEPVHVTCTSAAGDKLMGWVVKTDEFAKFWGYPIREDGTVPDTATLPAGKYRIIALYKNEYATYSTPSSAVFEVVE